MFIFVIQWLETEIVRLSHLRDRASEKGRRKEYPFLLSNIQICIMIYLAVLCPRFFSFP